MIRITAPHVAAALLGMTAALSPAPVCNASGPECADVAVSTRVCVRGPGHTAIVTSPDPAFTNPYPGWGFGTLGVPAFVGGGGWTGF